MTKYYLGDCPSNVGPRKEMDFTPNHLYIWSHSVSVNLDGHSPDFPCVILQDTAAQKDIKTSVISINLKIPFP